MASAIAPDGHRAARTPHRSLVVCALTAALVVGTGAAPLPVVGVHVSERTERLAHLAAGPETPHEADKTGTEWWLTEWPYFVIPEALAEALRSDGTPFVRVRDAEIEAGALLHPDGTPRLPIVVSLAAEAVDDAAVPRLLAYVEAGGFLLVGGSAFTRRPDGTTRGDFALADAMRLHMRVPALWNWYGGDVLEKLVDHRLVAHVPWGSLGWWLPGSAEEIPFGIGAEAIHTKQLRWMVTATGAEVLAHGDQGPLVATRAVGRGRVIYAGWLQPLLAHGSFDVGTYTYVIFRRAIEWAFEAAGLPLVRLAPWPYAYDAALLVRHDLENMADEMRELEESARFERALGVRGEYYLCTGTLRAGAEDSQLDDAGKADVIASLRRAVERHGALVGSHNGGFPNPIGPYQPNHYHYWHWGPDEALDATPAGWPNGAAYAEASVEMSFRDIEGWLEGLDNGRPGCGVRRDCPRVFAAPFLNATREGSRRLLTRLGVIASGEAKLGPFPHWALSTTVEGARFRLLELPTSEWYVGEQIAQSAEHLHTPDSIRAAVDFYHGLGGLVNVYAHGSSATGVRRDYVEHAAGKERIWPTNAVEVHDWWTGRSDVRVKPAFRRSAAHDTAVATARGATDPATAVSIRFPGGQLAAGALLGVRRDGVAVPAEDVRETADGVTVRVGATGPRPVRLEATWCLAGATCPR